MTSLDVAFGTLAQQLGHAVSAAGIEVPQLDLTDLRRVDDLSQRFLWWFDRLAERVQETIQVLLLLDEFHKWIVGLTKSERLALLGAFRHFNDRAGQSRLKVSFVLSGLQNLGTLYRESADLANAVEPFEVCDLTLDEADRYVRQRVPLDLDGRSRRRLISLSGGNPYVLNRLSGNLVEFLKTNKRTWCTSADIDNLLGLDDAQTGRLAKFVEYMLHEDEDDSAPTLRQLTVLRSVASTLRERGDFDGYVRVTDVEAWLARNNVSFEHGEPARQMDQLATLGVIQPLNGGRFTLKGEWLCRQLAALDPVKVPLQPVTAKTDDGLVLGRYRLIERLDEGGEAHVWRAENVLEGGHPVALRIYPSSTPNLRDRIERERSILERIRHPNVVGFQGAQVDERHGGVIILTFVVGDTLQAILQKRGPGSEQLVSHLPSQVAFLTKVVDAVAACHHAGVVHKDLSPRNVMATLQTGVWEPTVIDFGISGLATEPIADQRTTVFGTPGYIAPEKSKTGRRSAPADIYSLGVLFLRLLTGEEPEICLAGNNLEKVCRDAKLPTRLVSLIETMIVDGPEDRPTAIAVRDALATVLEPTTWIEIRGQADNAYLDERFDDALALYGQAIAAVPGPEQHGTNYAALLGDARHSFESGHLVPWSAEWLQAIFRLAKRDDWKPPAELLDVLTRYTGRFREQGSGLLRQVLELLAEPPAVRTLAGLASAVARDDRFRKPAFSTQAFEALAEYQLAGLLDESTSAAFAVAVARMARVQLSLPLVAELWLQRARYAGGGAREDYNREATELEAARRKTGRRQTLPPTPQKQEEMRIGEDERGHLKVERLKTFDGRARRLFPFIAQIKRVKKDNAVRVSRPTLFGLSHIARHIPTGTADPGNILPAALDGSFTAEGVPLRINVFLAADVTPSQREAALAVLRDANDIFDYQD